MKAVHFFRLLTLIGLMTGSSALICMERETIYDSVVNQFVKDTAPTLSWFFSPDYSSYSTELLKTYSDFIRKTSNPSAFKKLKTALNDTIQNRPQQPRTPSQSSPSTQSIIKPPAERHIKNWNNIRNAIYFCDPEKLYGEFSDFYHAQIKLNHIKWPSNETYYLAMQYTDQDQAKIISHIQSLQQSRQPFSLSSISQYANQFSKRQSTENEKIKWMNFAIYAKFAQNKDLQKILLGTGNHILVYADENNGIAGVGLDFHGNYTGQNQLGRILMYVRRQLQSEPNTDYSPQTTFALGSEELEALYDPHGSDIDLAEVIYIGERKHKGLKTDVSVCK